MSETDGGHGSEMISLGNIRNTLTIDTQGTEKCESRLIEIWDLSGAVDHRQWSFFDPRTQLANVSGQPDVDWHV